MTSESVAVEAALRSEWGRVLASVARATGDLDLAEDATAEAFAAAVATWPRDGVPDNPGAWLTTTARRKAMDALRRDATYARKLALLQTDADRRGEEVTSAFPDERLELVFGCCHPALSTDAQIALTLRCLTGLTTAEIARAFLVPEATMAQRLVRAKKKVSAATLPLRVPPAGELPGRLDAVLSVIYLVFNEGYLASAGAEVVRTDLVERAIDLGRMLVALMPDEAEAAALLALMLFHDSRRATRRDAAGALVLLADQDRSRWDHEQVAEAVRLVRRVWRRAPDGPYVLQALIAAAHATAPSSDETDWRLVAGLYRRLLAVRPTPVVALNQAVAVSFAEGPAAALPLVDALAGELDRYHLFHATRADLLRRLGRTDDARVAYERALGLTSNEAERAFLQSRL
jgi:RNA polymerase sigma-70 factor, ECF subfamily